MNSSAFFLVLSCAVTAALACANCGPPVDPIQPCGQPDCSIPENQQNIALFPHPDPNFFWQCHPTPNGWEPIARQCACGTVFNPFLTVRRCSFWFEEGWQPICGWQSPPVLAPCPTWCPDCNGPPSTTPTQTLPTTTQTTTTSSVGEDPGTTNGPGECPIWPPPCPPQCPPCIWWPCWPCDPCNWCNNAGNSRDLVSRNHFF